MHMLHMRHAPITIYFFNHVFHFPHNLLVMHSKYCMDNQPLGETSGNPPILRTRARGRGFSTGGAPLHPPATEMSTPPPPPVNSGSTNAGPPVQDPMDTSGYGGSGSDLSLADDEVNRLLEEDKDDQDMEDKEAKDYASIISKMETRLAATETMSLRNKTNLSTMGRTQLSTISRVLRIERETVRG